jgi:arginyl-tRNA synthetase
VIAFDFKEALSFEGETGPYAQYAVVRASNIFRKGGVDTDTATDLASRDFGQFLLADELWELWLAASKTDYVIEQCIATTEPAYAAKHAFQLAQAFNNFYHQYPILSEPDKRGGRCHERSRAVRKPL